MADYRVNLEIFAGPMDLLLYLVRKEEVDIYDIPISRITEQYLRYVEMLKDLDIDLAGDFLVMASTLMQIKSAMLLPQADPDAVEDDDTGNPRAELIRQLLEYKRFKDAANLLEAAAQKQMQRHPRSDSIIDKLKPTTEPELDMDQVSIWDLLDAFDRICKATGGVVFDVSHIRDDTPIDLLQIEILHRLQTEGPLTFERIFEGSKERIMIVGRFLAMLELIRDKLIWAEQADGGGVFVRALTDEPAEQAVQSVIFKSMNALEAEGAAMAEASSGPVEENFDAGRPEIEAFDEDTELLDELDEDDSFLDAEDRALLKKDDEEVFEFREPVYETGTTEPEAEQEELAEEESEASAIEAVEEQTEEAVEEVEAVEQGADIPIPIEELPAKRKAAKTDDADLEQAGFADSSESDRTE